MSDIILSLPDAAAAFTATPTTPGMSAVPIAKTVFAAGGKDVIATPDQMHLSPVAPINSQPAMSDADIDTLLDSLTPKPSPIGDFFNSVKDKLGKNVVAALSSTKSQLNAIHQITAILGGSKSALTNLEAGTLTQLLAAANVPTGIAAQLGAGLAGVPGAISPKTLLLNQIPDYSLVVNGIATIRKLPNDMKVEGVMGLVNALANSAGLGDVAAAFNYTAQLGVVKSVLNQVMAYGIPALVDATIAGIESIADQRKILLGCALNAAQAGDAYTLGLAVDRCGSQALLAHYPNIVAVYLANYRYPDGSNYPNSGDASTLVDLLVGLDPNWAQYLRAGTWIPDLTNFGACNTQARAQLTLMPDYVVQVMIAPSYPIQPLSVIAKLQYPALALPLN